MGKVLILRTCKSDMTSHGGFKWKRRGVVVAPDWSPVPLCGKGLHGLLWGEGDGSALDWSENAVWIVAKVEEDEIVDLIGKVKFPRAQVVFVGSRQGATDYILQSGGHGRSVVGCISRSGYRGTSISGYLGTSISGEHGTSISRDRGTSTSGDRGASSSGDNGTSTSGFRGTSVSGDFGASVSGNWGTSRSGCRGISVSGKCGTSTAGDDGTSTSGEHGVSISGDYGTSVSGDYGTSISGIGGTCAAGERGTIKIYFLDRKFERDQKIGHVGENGIEANEKYRLNKSNDFERVA